MPVIGRALSVWRTVRSEKCKTNSAMSVLRRRVRYGARWGERKIESKAVCEVGEHSRACEGMRALRNGRSAGCERFADAELDRGYRIEPDSGWPASGELAIKSWKSRAGGWRAPGSRFYQRIVSQKKGKMNEKFSPNFTEVARSLPGD